MSNGVETKGEYTPVKSTYNMGFFDFQRYHELMKFIDENGINSRGKRPQESMPAYCSGLKQLFINLSPIMSAEQVKELTDELRYCEALMRKQTFTLDVLERLEDINLRLVKIKQIAGLGLTLNATQTEAEIKRNVYGVH